MSFFLLTVSEFHRAIFSEPAVVIGMVCWTSPKIMWGLYRRSFTLRSMCKMLNKLDMIMMRTIFIQREHYPVWDDEKTTAPAG